MKTSINSTTNFQANYVMSTKVKRKPFLKKSCDQLVSFVKFDKSSEYDIKTILKLQEKWQPSLVDDILYHLISIWREKVSIYFLTKQNRNFKELDYSDILGIVTTFPNNKNQVCIDFLQVSPKYLNNKNRKLNSVTDFFSDKYTYCGSAILNCLKETYSNKDLYLYHSENNIDFYKKNGFVQNFENNLVSVYKNFDKQVK